MDVELATDVSDIEGKVLALESGPLESGEEKKEGKRNPVIVEIVQKAERNGAVGVMVFGSTGVKTPP